MRLTEAEWKIMNVLWERYPASAREVLESLVGEVDWAYTTVKTMLSRLVDKRVLKAEMRGNTAYYTPLLEKREARRTALRVVLDSAFDGAFGTMMHFLVSDKEMSEREREELKSMMERQNRP